MPTTTTAPARRGASKKRRKRGERERVNVERGLYYRLDVDGVRIYEACATPPGEKQPIWKTIGRVGIEKAREERDEHRRRVKKEPLPEKQKRTAVWSTVADLALGELDERLRAKEVTPRTRAAYRGVILNHFVARFGDKRCSATTKEHLAQWIRELKASDASESAVLLRWHGARVVIGYARRFGFIGQDPAARLHRNELPVQPGHRVVFLTREQMKALFSAARRFEHLSSPSHNNPRHRPQSEIALRRLVNLVAISLMLFAGLRISEVAGLWWQDFDLDAAELRLVAQLRHRGPRERIPLKSRKTIPAYTDDDVRVLPLPQWLVVLLRELRLMVGPECQWVCAQLDGTPEGQDIIRYDFNRCRDAAGIPDDVTPHALRHTFATVLRHEGEEVEYISRKLGHRKVSITQDIYTHLFGEEEKDQRVRGKLAAYESLLDDSPDADVVALPIPPSPVAAAA